MSVRNYRTLDGIRGMAALSIVILHCHRYFAGIALPVAHLAVDLFFVLSGFVLAHAYEKRFEAGMSAGRFMLVRLIRLYPLYLAGTLLGLVEAVLIIRYQQGAREMSLGELLWTLPYSLAMVPTPGARTLYPLDGVMWSIFFELVVNLIWVVLWKPLRSTLVLLATVLVSAGALAWFSLAAGTMSLGLDWGSLSGGLARVCFGFFFGVLLYRWHTRIPLPRVHPVLLLAAVPAIFALPLSDPAQLFAALFVLPLLVLFGAKVEPAGWLSRLCHFIGVTSYAVYATHKRVYLLSYAALLQIFGWPAERAAPWIGFLFLGLLLGGCAIADRIYDLPVRRWLTRRLGGDARRREQEERAVVAEQAGPSAAP